MPGFDRTGPSGQGPRTGRGLGPCGSGTGFRRGRGMGFARGFGPRRGLGPRYDEQAEPTKEEQRMLLEAELQGLEAERKELEARLKELR